MGSEHAEPASGAGEDTAARLEQLEAILQLAPVGIGLVDGEGRTTMTNGALHRMLGYTPEEFAALSWADYTHPDDIPINAEFSRQLAAGEIDGFQMEKRFRRKDGTWLWTSLLVSLVRKPDGSPQYEIGMTTDITERKRLESDLRTAEERYRVLVERVPAVVYSAAPGAFGRWHYVSPQIETMLGFTAQEWMADSGLWWRQVEPSARATVLTSEQLMLNKGSAEDRRSDTYRMFRKDGSAIWVRDDAIVVYDTAGTPTIQGVLVDVTQEKKLEERLGHDAYHDPLTGLPNRSLFKERVDIALEGPELLGTGTVVLFIDLDNFKSVNDSFGHAAGDEVIQAAAARIRSCAGEGDVAARLGGDEFALLLTNATPERGSELAGRILHVLNDTPVSFSGGTVKVNASVGIAHPQPGDTADDLLRNADLAMYQAKYRGRGRHVMYERNMHEGAVAQFLLTEALQVAVAHELIDPVFQPIADLHTGRVVGLETLARWTDPELGAVPPSEFIPLAEQSGLIPELGRQLLTKACTNLVAWRELTGGDAYVAVNVSPLQLEDEDFPDLVAGTLEKAGLEPRHLLLEVTEGLLLEERARTALHTLRHLGVRVAIDDFGTGYSSLSRLGDLPIDTLKIDQAFLRGLGVEGQQSAVLHAVISLAHTLHLTTIAEGVETVEQLAALRLTSCGLGQGYLLARPGAIEDIPARLAVNESVS